MTTAQSGERRANSLRAHERIIAAADAALAESDELSFNAIARAADVGVGTVYRHFPTPEALVLAVYQLEVQHLIEVVPTLLETHTPEDAFTIWVHDHLVQYMVTKRGLANALRVAPTNRETHNRGFADITRAVSALVQANIEAGTVRPDLDPRIVMLGLSGFLHLDPDGDQEAQTARLTDLLWRGMCADNG
jgi:AcrR family transcriptional regulator